MKNSGMKGAFGALAVAGVVLAAKKLAKKRNFIKDIMDQYGIKEKSPLAFADRIRELDDEQYSELKKKFKSQFASKCCNSAWKKSCAKA